MTKDSRFSYLDDGQIREIVPRFLDETGRDPSRILSVCFSSVQRADEKMQSFEYRMNENRRLWGSAGDDVVQLLKRFLDVMREQEGVFADARACADLCRMSVGMLLSFDDMNRNFREASAEISCMETEFPELRQAIVQADGYISVGRSACRTLGINKPELDEYSENVKKLQIRLEKQISFLSTFQNSIIVYFSKRCESFAQELERLADFEHNGEGASYRAVSELIGQMLRALDEFLNVQ